MILLVFVRVVSHEGALLSGQATVQANAFVVLLVAVAKMPDHGTASASSKKISHEKSTWAGVRLVSCSQCRELCQQASWLRIGCRGSSEPPIRSRVSSLTQLLTMTKTHKFQLLSKQE